MKRRQWLRYAGASATLAALPIASRAATGRAFAAIPKSLWVWGVGLSSAHAVIQFALKYGFGTVFWALESADRTALYANSALELAELKAFRVAGLAFYAAAGSPQWCLQTSPQVPLVVAELIAFQQRAGLFDGLSLDIEPQALPEWGTAQEAQVIKGYLGVLRAVVEACAPLPLTVDATVIPPYAATGTPGTPGVTLLQSVAALVRASVIMAYRNVPANAVRYAARALAQLRTLGKPWWFGVTTSANADAGVSYNGFTGPEFESAMTTLDGLLLGQYAPGYLGLAINAYAPLLRVLNRP